jgi:hypothetical protein
MEKQVEQTDILTELVGHEHHCQVCGDVDDLYWVVEKGGQGILCGDCIRIQRAMHWSVFLSIEPYRRSSP